MLTVGVFSLGMEVDCHGRTRIDEKYQSPFPLIIFMQEQAEELEFSCQKTEPYQLR